MTKANTKKKQPKERKTRVQKSEMPVAYDKLADVLTEVEEEDVAPDIYEKIGNIISTFPQEGLVHVCAYGSGVFPQLDRPLGNMIDLIIIVENAVMWHEKNLEVNPQHYSMASRLLRAGGIAWIQQKIGCGIYYNTYAKISGCVVKYGVITWEAFLEDLKSWKYMYVAGRLHKPVLHFPRGFTTQNDGFKSLLAAVNYNREQALNYAVMMQPSTFTELELCLTIARISYQGDSRMYVGGEHNEKVDAMVVPMIDAYGIIYDRCKFARQFGVEYNEHTDLFMKISPCPSATNQWLNKMPHDFKIKMAEYVRAQETSIFTLAPFRRNKGLSAKDVDDNLKALSKRRELPTIMSSVMSKTVFRSSLWQTMVGFISTGWINSFWYAYEKFMKRTKPRAIILEQAEVEENKESKKEKQTEANGLDGKKSEATNKYVQEGQEKEDVLPVLQGNEELGQEEEEEQAELGKQKSE